MTNQSDGDSEEAHMRSKNEIRQRLEEIKNTEQSYADADFLQGERHALEWVLEENEADKDA